jgi:arylsulfatase
MAFLFSFDETLDVGRDLGTPVSADYPARGNEFTGTVNWVQIDVDAAAANADHLITPEQRMTIAMLRH